MRKLLPLMVLMFLCFAAAPAMAAKTLELMDNRTDNIVIPNQGLVFVVPENLEVELSGVLSGAGPLIKRGEGTLVLSGDNTHTGDTLVEAGVVRLQTASALNLASGTIAVKGKTAVIESLVDLEVGQSGDCRLMVSNGGRFYTVDDKRLSIGNGANMQIDISGAGSEIAGYVITIGLKGKVELNVGDGGKLTAADDLIVSDDIATVTAYIAGSGTQVSGAGVFLGWRGKAEFNVQNGGALFAATRNLYCGWGQGTQGVLNISGAETAVYASGAMYLGYKGGHARVTVENGALLQTLVPDDTAGHEIYLAHGPESSARVFIKYPGSKLISGGDLVVGVGGDAHLDVRNKGRVSFQGGLCMGFAEGGKGVTRVTGAGAVLADYTRLYDNNGEFTGFIESVSPEPDVYYGDSDGEEYYEGDYEYEENDTEEEADRPDYIPALSIVVGYRGYGELHINKEARVEISGDLYAGFHAGARGIVQASGYRAKLMAARNLYIGHSGRGELLFEGGAEGIGDYNAAMIYIANNEGSSAKVDIKGINSCLTASREIMGGYKGQAVINLTEGGALRAMERSILLGVYEGSKAEINVQGVDSALQSGSAFASAYEGKLEIGSYGKAEVNIRDGGRVYASGDTYLGMYGQGVVNLWDDRAVLKVDGNLDIGANGYGELNIGPGVTFTYRPDSSRRELSLYLGRFTTGSGVINMGAKSGLISHEYVYAGGSGRGEIYMAADSVLELNSASFYLGKEYDGFGSLAADNAGIKVSDLNVGDYGNGELKLVNGSRLNVYRMWVASNALSKASVLLDASTMESLQGLEVGHYGEGRMDVLNGSTVTLGYTLYIGSTYGKAKGVMVVDNSKVTVEQSDLSVGVAGMGRLDIQNGGKVTVAENINLGYHEGYTGTINVSGAGSVLTGNKHFYIGLRGNGVLNITDGGNVKVLRDTHVGLRTEGSGTLKIDGLGSSLTAGAVIESEMGGNATVDLTDDGQIIIIDRDREADEFQDTVDWINSFEFSM